MSGSIKRSLAVLVGLTLVAFFLGAQMALATSGECQTFQGHSGQVPGSYDYAEFYEDGELVVTVDTNGQDIYVDPGDYDAGSKWDQVKKCDRPDDTTTTTIDDSTTTSIDDTTTTTAGEETTTTVAETTTTIGETTTTEPLGFTYAVLCLEAGGSVLEVHVVGLQPGDVVSMGDDSIEVLTTRANVTQVLNGTQTFDVLVNGESIGSVTESARVDCEVPSTTEPPEVADDREELPFTGLDTPLLGAAGLILLASGRALLRRSRSVSE